MAVLCRQFNIWRKAGYKILARYRDVDRVYRGLTDLEAQCCSFKNFTQASIACLAASMLSRVSGPLIRSESAIPTLCRAALRSSSPERMIIIPWSATSVALRSVATSFEFSADDADSVPIII